MSIRFANNKQFKFFLDHALVNVSYTKVANNIVDHSSIDP